MRHLSSVMISGVTKLELIPINVERPTGKKSSVIFIEQFVKDVYEFSSQYGSDTSISYTAYNIAGNPSRFPDYGDFPQAFVMVCCMLCGCLVRQLYSSLISQV